MERNSAEFLKHQMQEGARAFGPMLSKFRKLLPEGRFTEIEEMGDGGGLSATEIEVELRALAVTSLDRPQSQRLLTTHRSSIYIEKDRIRREMQYRLWIKESATPDLVADLSLIQVKNHTCILNVRQFRIAPLGPGNAQTFPAENE